MNTRKRMDLVPSNDVCYISHLMAGHGPKCAPCSSKRKGTMETNRYTKSRCIEDDRHAWGVLDMVREIALQRNVA